MGRMRSGGCEALRVAVLRNLWCVGHLPVPELKVEVCKCFS